MFKRGLPLVLAVLASGAAEAATISGTITDTSNVPLVNMEVRAWANGGKGYAIVATAMSDASGNYSLSVGAGTFLVDARMSVNATGDYGDRWYDLISPSGNGYVEADADPLVLATGDNAPGINIALEVCGGIDGNIGFAGPEIRFELKAEVRTNHVDFAQASPHLGDYVFRGLVPGDYRVIAWDLNGIYETYVNGGPFTVTSNAVTPGPALGFTPMTPDPNEPNDSPTATGSAIDGTVFHTTPAGSFSSGGALIGPRGSDVDFYCWDVKAHDRYFITAQGQLTLEDGSMRPHPYVDPVIGLFDVTGGAMTFLKQDDDSGPVPLSAKLDTGPYAADGRTCAVVSTYGDTGYNGAAQGSAGRYGVTIVMGNRSPDLQAKVMSAPAGSTITINEGDTLNVDVTYSDPDGDPVTAGYEFVDSASMGVSAGAFTGPSSGTFTWTANQIAARRSPYTLHLHAADAEFTTPLDITVIVNEVNVPPTTPVLLSPADKSVVATPTPVLVCAQSTDLDFDPLTYRFELYYEDAGTAAQAAWISPPDGGAADAGVVWQTTGTIPENTHVHWRARAFDGNATNGYSPWSSYFNFVVSAVNDPPSAPVITKPVDGDTVIPKRPTIEVTNPIDPEGEGVSLFIQIASDAQFMTVVASSPSLPTAGSSMTMWTTTQALTQGTKYWVRAWGLDPEGAQSPYSNVVSFNLKADAPPMAVAPDAPFVAQCDDLKLMTPPPMISVTPSTDPDNDAVQIQMQIFLASDNADTATPVFDKTEDQAMGSTQFDTSGVTFQAGVKYRVRVRATDGVIPSPWADCFLTVGTGTKTTQKGKGCGCGALDGSLALALLGMASLLRRRRS